MSTKEIQDELDYIRSVVSNEKYDPDVKDSLIMETIERIESLLKEDSFECYGDMVHGC